MPCQSVDVDTLIANSHLIKDTWDEVDQRKEAGMKLDPDWDLMKVLESMGNLKCYLFGDYGYAIFVLSPDLHRKDKTIAVSSVMYLDKEHRGELESLLPTIEKELKDCGADMISLIVKTREQGKLYDYKLYEKIYQRFI